MTVDTAESAFVLVCLGIIGAATAALLAWISLLRPRLGLYALLALAPTQFIFVPVADFFISPADVLACGAGAGLFLRVASGNSRARRAVHLHALLGLMLVGYLVGFVVLDHSSRTLVRLPLAIVPSLLACEVLVTRRHFALAVTAIIVAGLLDATYGLAAMAAGASLHPSRFSGMMGVNFSAIAILTAAAMAASLVAQSRSTLKLLATGLLALLGLATLSKMGIVALVAALILVFWPLAIPANRRRAAMAAVLLLTVSLAHPALRERLVARAAAEVQHDGIARTSTAVRTLILRTAWDAFTAQPFVGVGFFNFQNHSLSNAEIRQSTAGVGYVTHNTFLAVTVEGGVIAVAGFVLHFLTYARSIPLLWIAMVRRRDVLVGATVAGLVVVLLSAAVADVLLHYLFWGVSGVALACFSRLRGVQIGTPSAASGNGLLPGPARSRGI